MSEKQYVVFKLGVEEYGVNIMAVREITDYKNTTKIPNAPNFIDGVINLRGSVIPVINLKRRFNLKEAKIRPNSRIIITNLDKQQVGFIVDDASQVITLDEKDIDDPSKMIIGIDKKYIVGMAKVKEEIIILLDLVEIITTKEKEELKNVVE